MSARPLSEDEIEAIATRVAELVREPASRLMTVEEVADLLRVHPEWVYANADYLGAFRLGRGERGRLRFDRHRVLERVESPRVREQRRERARRPRPSAKAELLPIGLKR